MKIALSVFLVFLTCNSFASTMRWSQLREYNNYELSQKIILVGDDSSFAIESGSKLELLEVTSLEMLKVNLYKLKVKNCRNNNLSTDLDLVQVPQRNSRNIVSVGVDLAEKCILEVFVENKDLKTYSFLN